MRFENLVYTGIKDRAEVISLTPVTVFYGRSRSGKSAAMEASRLAATNEYSQGKSVERQKELIGPHGASAELAGKNLSAHWSYIGTRKWSIACDGMNVTSVHGDMPVVFQDFLALTGEDKWKLVESIVGKFSKPEPTAVADIESQIAKLNAVSKTEPWTGRSIESLDVEIRELESVLEQQKTLAKNAGYKKQRVKDAKNRIAGFFEDAKGFEYEIKLDEEEYDKWSEIHSTAIKMLESFNPGPLDRLQAYGELTGGTTGGICAHLEALIGSIIDDLEVSGIAEGWQCVKARKLTTGFLGSLACCIAGETIPSPDFSAFEKLLGKNIGSTDNLNHDIEHLAQHNSSLLSTIANKKQRLENIKNEIKKLEAECNVDESEFASLLTPEQIGEKTALLEKLKEDRSKATAYRTYLSFVEQRAEKLAELTAKLEVAKKEMVAYKAERAEYLNKALEATCKIANEILSLMNLPPVSVEFNLKGSRSSMSISAGGVNLSTMAGSERVIYGSLVLFSIAQAKKPKIPLLWVEAAEMDSDLLLLFVNAVHRCMEKNCLPGNVFVAHHGNFAGMLPSSVNSVDFSSPVG